MSAAKPAIACVLVLGLAAIPLFWQESKAGKLRAEIADLGERESAATAKIAKYKTGLAAFEAHPELESTRTVRDLIAYSEQGVKVEEMMASIMEVMMTQDLIGMLKVFLPMANLDREAYAQLLEDLENYQGNAQTKMMVIQMATMFAPSTNPSEALERLVKLDVEPYSYASVLGEWASDDPAAALAWYETKLEAGELSGKGIDNHAERYLLGQLIGGMAKKDPEGAVDYFIRESDVSGGELYNATRSLGTSLGFAMKDTGDDTQLRRLLEWDVDGVHTSQIVQSAMRGALDGKEFSDATRFVETYLEDAQEQQSAIIAHVSNDSDQPFGERADQLVGYLPEERAIDAVRQLTNSGYSSNRLDPERQQWVESQPPGPIRDAGWRGLVENQMMFEQYEEAYALVGNISDATSREAILVDLGRGWMREDAEAARSALPADTIRDLEQIESDLTTPSE